MIGNGAYPSVHLWPLDQDGTAYHATECWCWSSGLYGAPEPPRRHLSGEVPNPPTRPYGCCSPMGTNARGVAQCSEGHGDYPDACEEAIPPLHASGEQEAQR